MTHSPKKRKEIKAWAIFDKCCNKIDLVNDYYRIHKSKKIAREETGEGRIIPITITYSLINNLKGKKK